jgi:hypothetical protein
LPPGVYDSCNQWARLTVTANYTATFEMVLTESSGTIAVHGARGTASDFNTARFSVVNEDVVWVRVDPDQTWFPVGNPTTWRKIGDVNY